MDFLCVAVAIVIQRVDGIAGLVCQELLIATVLLLVVKRRPFLEVKKNVGFCIVLVVSMIQPLSSFFSAQSWASTSATAACTYLVIICFLIYCIGILLIMILKRCGYNFDLRCLAYYYRFCYRRRKRTVPDKRELEESKKLLFSITDIFVVANMHKQAELFSMEENITNCSM